MTAARTSLGLPATDAAAPIRAIGAWVFAILVATAGGAVIRLSAPSLVRWLVELGDSAAAKPTPGEVDHIADGAALILWGTGLILVAIWMKQARILAVAAALVIVYALYLIGSIPKELVGFASDQGWPTTQQALYATAGGSQLLGAFIVVSVILIAWRGDWSLFAVALTGVLAAGAILLGVVAGLHDPFVSAKPATAGELSVRATVIGASLTNKDPVTVVFVIPKKNDNGVVISTDQTARSAVVAGTPACAQANPADCTVTLDVKRGDQDASIAPWFADRLAATAIFVVGPTGVPPAPGG